MSHFDIMAAPAGGAHLIDASAGTGKTYTISGLVARMIVEYRWPIEDILVVTFTEAAATDLKKRIREMLTKVVGAFAGNDKGDDFVARLVGATPDHQGALCLLNIALQNFDEASIFTIHGFCQRVLQDNFLESGLLLDSELETDQWRILREIIEDFFRANLYEISPLYLSHALQRLLPEKLRKFLGVYYSREDMRIVPEIEREKLMREIAAAEEDFAGRFTAVTSLWPRVRDEVERILLKDEGFNRRNYSLKSIPLWLASFDAMTVRPALDISLFDNFHKFATATIRSSMKKDFVAPEHEFFNLCGDLLQARNFLVELFEQQIILHRQDLYRYVREELGRRKETGGYYTFDDMLKGLSFALDGVNGNKLARAVAARYKGALIDEFQDTDPVQYRIFKAIFSGSDTLLLLIGDPKQAIYSFRGADIFAYMQAVREVESRYTLGFNWRSVPGLIEATNTFFSTRSLPFLFKEIRFDKAEPAEKEHECFTVDGRVEEPFQLVLLERIGDDDPYKLLDKDVARERILAGMSGEIRRLLSLGAQGRALIGDREVCAGDIAVLVRTNREARLAQKVLADSGVASVLCSSESLFVSREAEELLIILEALANPVDSRALRAALATRIIDAGAHELDILEDEQGAFILWVEKFREYHDLWMDRGFGYMFSRFLTREGVKLRLLKAAGGERSVTNLLHLHELLHLAAVERRLGVAGLCKYLRELIAETPYDVPDEHQLRLESEAELVQIVTIHKAKGLQYPIVFCPFSWEGTRIPRINKEGRLPGDSNGLLYHDREDGLKLVLDIGSQDIEASRIAAFQEELAENLRILYVALTRAIQRCYFFWGPIKDAGTSAAAYLIHHRRNGGADELAPDNADILSKLDDEQIREDAMHLVAASKGSIFVAANESRGGLTVERETESFEGEWSKFTGRIDRHWRISSFSLLAHVLQDRTSRTVLPLQRINSDRKDSFAEIRDFPRGAGPGVFLHSLLEGLDFPSADLPAGKDWVERCLARGGYDPGWQGAVVSMLQNVLNTPLPTGDHEVRLVDIEKKDRLDELEFYFPCENLMLMELTEFLVGEFGVQTSGNVWSNNEQNRVRGFMKGYIDLVFCARDRYHIVDWKSNHLGYADEDYDVQALENVMAGEMYTLQYLIYTVALHRYLEQRLPGYDYEKHFGGIYYLFLRGVGWKNGSRYGVYHVRPDKKKVLRAAAILSREQR